MQRVDHAMAVQELLGWNQQTLSATRMQFERIWLAT